jgi:hypothetical protein
MSGETVTTRTGGRVHEQFASFSSFILTMLENRKGDTFISFACIWCELCDPPIINPVWQASSKPTTSSFYHATSATAAILTSALLTITRESDAWIYVIR